MGRHEGKITGLAAYGRDAYRDVLARFLRAEDGSMRNVGNAFRRSAVEKLRRALPPDFRREDLAASVQLLAEEVCTRYVGHWAARTGRRRVALAGGVVSNVKINQRIHELPGVESLYVFPAMSDEGLGAGAALLVDARRRPGAPPHGEPCFEHVYLGPDFDERSAAAALDAAGVAYARAEDPAREIARLVAEGYVVARASGAMEYGPRALGNRSILYRPDDPSVNDWLNERLRRTEFMPFAPSTLAEDAERCYAGLEGARDAARFMTITFDCSEAMKRECPGVVHADGTARPQLVSARDNPAYYAILREFQRLTGLSSLVNTSFNIHEEPIVCTPEDAVRAFRIGHLDVLALGTLFARNPGADARVRAAAARAPASAARSR
jgi:carbamoyltransferase